MKQPKVIAILTTLAVLLVFAAGWLLVLSPKRAAIADLREQRAAAATRQAQARTQIQMLEEQAANLPAQQQRLRTFAKRMTKAAELPALVRTIDTTARSAGAAFVTITPGAPAAPDSTAAGAAPAPTGGSGYLAVPLTVVAEGSYAQLVRFLTGLETLPRAVRVTGVAVARPDSSGSSSQTPTLQATITASAYVAAGAPAAPVPTPSGATGADPS